MGREVLLQSRLILSVPTMPRKVKEGECFRCGLVKPFSFFLVLSSPLPVGWRTPSLNDLSVLARILKPAFAVVLGKTVCLSS
jgi:hypothetical protein